MCGNDLLPYLALQRAIRSGLQLAQTPSVIRGMIGRYSVPGLYPGLFGRMDFQHGIFQRQFLKIGVQLLRIHLQHFYGHGHLLVHDQLLSLFQMNFHIRTPFAPIYRRIVDIIT